MSYQPIHLTPGSAPGDDLPPNDNTPLPPANAFAPAQVFVPYQGAPLYAYDPITPTPTFVPQPLPAVYNGAWGPPDMYAAQPYPQALAIDDSPATFQNGHAPVALAFASESQPAPVHFGGPRATDWGSAQMWLGAGEVGMRAPMGATMTMAVPQQQLVQTPSQVSTMAVPPASSAARAQVSMRPAMKHRRTKRVSKPYYPCDWKKIMAAGAETAVPSVPSAKSVPEVAVAGAGFVPKVWGFAPARRPQEVMPNPWAFEGAGDYFLLGNDTQWDPVQETEPLVAEQEFPRWLDRAALFWDDAPGVGERIAPTRRGGQAVLGGRVEKLKGRGAGKTARRPEMVKSVVEGRVQEQVVGGQVQRDLVQEGPVEPQEHSLVEEERPVE